MDPDSVGSLDPDPDPRRAKMTHKHRKKLMNFNFFKSRLRAEGFSYSLDISKLQFFLTKISFICFLQFLVIKTLDQDPDPDAMNPDAMNPDPQLCLIG